MNVMDKCKYLNGIDNFYDLSIILANPYFGTDYNNEL
jgi:hypothetical protein